MQKGTNKKWKFQAFATRQRKIHKLIKWQYKKLC